MQDDFQDLESRSTRNLEFQIQFLRLTGFTELLQWTGLAINGNSFTPSSKQRCSLEESTLPRSEKAYTHISVIVVDKSSVFPWQRQQVEAGS